MNNNQKRINSFLHFLRDIMKNNPSFEISKNNIYDWVTKLDVSNKEYDEDLKKYGWFDEWQSLFPKQNRTINSPNTFFCKFANEELKFINVDNPIKLYIPIDFKHIKKSFEKIITFLNSKNIPYYAKISKEIRIDNIVLRITSEEDTKAIVDFINNDEYIKEGLRDPSPFCYNYKGIALALDAHMSYHSSVVNLIYEYIIDKKKNNDLDSIDYSDFETYSENFYKNRYENFSEFTKIILPDYGNKTAEERNYLIEKEITKLITSANKEGFNDEAFFKLFNEFNDTEKISNEKEDLCVLRFMNKIIAVHGGKYGIENALTGLKLYVQTGKITYITSRGMLREELETNNFLKKLRRFLAKYNTTIDELFVLLAKDNVKLLKLEPKNDEQIEKIKDNLDKKLVNIIDDLANIEIENIKNNGNSDNLNNTQIIQNALIASIRKLKFFFATFEPKTITRKKSLRQRCINIRADVLNIIYNSDIKLDDFLSYSLQDSLLLKESILDEAIYSTYKKYQKSYENGKIIYDGISFVKYALDILLTKNDYNGFTSSQNMRNNLYLVENNDLIKIISKRTNKPNIKTLLHSDTKRIDLIEEYINQVIKDFEKEKNSITL